MTAPSRLVLREIHSRPPEIKLGTSGWWVRLIQQILIERGMLIHKTGFMDDSTLTALGKFRAARGIREGSVCGPVTWAHLAIDDEEMILYVPLREAFLGATEIEKNNWGPWVRKYTGGLEGERWAWCAAFATWCLRQFERDSKRPGYKLLIKERYSSSRIFKEADNKHLLRSDPHPGDLALIKGGPTKYRHTALVSHYDAKGKLLWVIEGNVRANRIPWKWFPNMKRPLDGVRIGCYKPGSYVIVGTGV
jgi:hypothetical protein